MRFTTRRLQQNNRQLIDIFFPNGLRRDGEGWKPRLAYRLSRALIGNRLADAFAYPKRRPWEVGTLALFRAKQHVQRRWSGSQTLRANNFTQLLQIAVYDEGGLSYKLPDHVHADKSSRW